MTDEFDEERATLLARIRELRAENERLREEMTDRIWHCTGAAESQIDNLNTLLAQARAENERLREQKEVLALELGRVLGEIERLREIIAEWQEIHGTFTGDVHAACQAEIERLHLEVQRHQVTGDYEMGQRHMEATLMPEIERLRTEREVMTEGFIKKDRENERLRAQLESHAW